MSTETKCPQCGGKLISGYGFAFGEGIGVYVVCLDCSHVVGKAVEHPGQCFHEVMLPPAGPDDGETE